ncbi:MAG: hypothetical protein WCS37_22245 [Chloroflexota bacterium]
MSRQVLKLRKIRLGVRLAVRLDVRLAVLISLILILSVGLLWITPNPAQAQRETPPTDLSPLLVKVVGPYQVIVKHSPHPANPKTHLLLEIEVFQTNTTQGVTNATITINPSMPGMKMKGVLPVIAKLNPANRNYEAIVPVEMAGLWEFQVAIQSTQFPPAEFTLTDQVERDQLPWILIFALLLGLPCLMIRIWVYLLHKLVNELNTAYL